MQPNYAGGREAPGLPADPRRRIRGDPPHRCCRIPGGKRRKRRQPGGRKEMTNQTGGLRSGGRGRRAKREQTSGRFRRPFRGGSNRRVSGDRGEEFGGWDGSYAISSGRTVERLCRLGRTLVVFTCGIEARAAARGGCGGGTRTGTGDSTCMSSFQVPVPGTR